MHSSGAKKILFFPLGNVLGHLTRTLALAEEFDAQGHEVYVAVTDSCSHITRLLPSSIRILPTPEMYASASQHFGPIEHYDESAANDRMNLQNSSQMDESELRRRGKRMEQMVQRDTAIIEEIHPDAIITDYRFTTLLTQSNHTQEVFHISHVLGYPSFYRRVLGKFPFPLDEGHILVPGLKNIEYWRRRPRVSNSQHRETMCGMFRWDGWKRLQQDAPRPPHSEIFLFFGSTGNGRQIVPWLLRELQDHYHISCISQVLTDRDDRSNVHVSRRGDLEGFLERTEVVLCHGGHGTVMECILHRTPMLIFPHNIEQLEIGRRIEKMRLGVLAKRPYHQFSGKELIEIIEKTRTDSRIRANLEKYSRLIR